ncbi:hypothetical protein [Cohnella soli]|uniref:Uncharacterized protein n=1 Tax=Cohnella soli TaxID=425005 RepID=A0ABW0HMT6_9BACL
MLLYHLNQAATAAAKGNGVPSLTQVELDQILKELEEKATRAGLLSTTLKS